MRVWLHLRFVWRNVAKTDEGVFDLSRHGAMYFVLDLDVVPIEGEPKVAHSIPVRVDFVVLPKNAHKMLNVILVDVLHSKVINNEGETDRAPIVLPIARGDFALAIPGFLGALGE